MKKERPDMETFAAGIADKQDNPPLHKLAKEFPEKTYKELENYRDLDRQEEATQVPLTDAQRNLVDHIEAGSCIMGEMRKDREDIENVKKDADKLMINKITKYERKIAELEEALANSLEVNESHQRLNGKLQVRITELEDETQKIHKHLDKRIDDARKAGM